MNHEAIVSSVLSAFVERLGARDVQGALALFEGHATLLGSEEEEIAHGVVDLREFFERLYRQPHTYGWTWDEMTVDEAGEVIWFVAPAAFVVRQDDGIEQTAPYRLSGVLRHSSDGAWRFALFNGSEPAAPA